MTHPVTDEHNLTNAAFVVSKEKIYWHRIAVVTLNKKQPAYSILPEVQAEGGPCPWCAAGMFVCLKSSHVVVGLMVHSYASLLEVGPGCTPLDCVGDVVADPLVMVPEVVVPCLTEMAWVKGTAGEVPLGKESGEGA